MTRSSPSTKWSRSEMPGPSPRAVLAVLAHRRTRALAVAVVCLIGVRLLAGAAGDIYPIRDWLFWRLLVLWGWCALLHGACLTFGHLCATRWLGVRDRPVLETLVVSAAVGMVAFTLAMYLLGALALFRTGVAIALPIAMILAGGPGFLRFARERWRQREARAPSLSGLAAGAAMAFGVLGVGLLYLQSLTPDAINYDARWYHLTIAADYAREGRIVPFLADYNKAFPHLASIVHTWGWLAARPERAAALHAGAAQRALRRSVDAGGHRRRRSPGCSASGACAARGRRSFCSRSSSSTTATWAAAPITSSASSRCRCFWRRRARREDLSPRRCALAGALGAGALLTKYQAIYLLVPSRAGASAGAGSARRSGGGCGAGRPCFAGRRAGQRAALPQELALLPEPAVPVHGRHVRWQPAARARFAAADQVSADGRRDRPARAAARSDRRRAEAGVHVLVPPERRAGRAVPRALRQAGAADRIAVHAALAGAAVPARRPPAAAGRAGGAGRAHDLGPDLPGRSLPAGRGADPGRGDGRRSSSAPGSWGCRARGADRARRACRSSGAPTPRSTAAGGASATPPR